MKEYSRPVTGESFASTILYDGCPERPDTAKLFERRATELYSKLDIENHKPDAENQAPLTASNTFTPSEILFIITICFAQFLSLAGLAQTFALLMILSEVFHVSNPGAMAWPST